jgi:AcrR family transcriptional regulator
MIKLQGFMKQTEIEIETMPLRRDLRGPTKRTLDAIETKNKLFAVAIRLFSHYGYEAVTIDDITERASVSKGTFYTHFASKDAVLVEQFKQIDDAYIEAFSKYVKISSARDKLMLLIKTMCEYCSTVCGVNVLKIVYMNQISQGDHPEILGERNRPFYDILAEIIKEGKETGEFLPSIDNEEFVSLISRAARALIYDWCLYNGAFDLKTEGTRQFTLICDALRTQEKKHG